MRKLLPLKDIAVLKPFDCGDQDLNEFLCDNAILCEKEFLSKTYVLEDEEYTIAYFSLLADKISKSLIPKAVWENLNSKIPEEKHFNSYPSVKIGRLAVHKLYKGQHIGASILSLISSMVLASSEYVAFRFVTVDAYKSARGFYEQNDFVPLIKEEKPDRNTVPMYMDLKEFY